VISHKYTIPKPERMPISTPNSSSAHLKCSHCGLIFETTDRMRKFCLDAPCQAAKQAARRRGEALAREKREARAKRLEALRAAGLA
jgi:predicted  nucleic acid-binding Zn-ribbon protein